MWLAMIVVLGIVLCFAGLVLGVLPMVVPGLVILAGGLAFHFKGMRSGGDSTGRLEKGPVQDEHGHPEDTPGGPAHAATGHAHGGQGHMTP